MLTAVIPTEKATSPLQRNDMMFDETPPGHVPTSKSPIAIPLGSPKCTRVNAINGIMVNWESVPSKMSPGRFARMAKSCGERVSPMANIIMPRMMVCVEPLTHAKEGA